jgi:membrane protein DedA with SNARE-associated domain
MSFDFIPLEAIQNLAHTYGYWFVFFGIMLENAGIPFPGETIILVGGFLAGSHELSYPIVLICTIIGAILGDNFGYWLGRWGGLRVLEKIGGIFRFSHEDVAKARDRFVGNADRAVFFGRFITLLRIFAGPLAGLSGMSYRRFLFFNVSGAIVWSLTITSLAYFAGSFISLEQLAKYVTQFGLFVLLGILAWISIPQIFKFLKNSRSPDTKSSIPALPINKAISEIK